MESFARVLESWVWSRIAHRLPGWIRVLRIKVAEEDGAGEGLKGAKELPLEPECLFVCLVWFGFQWVTLLRVDSGLMSPSTHMAVNHRPPSLNQASCSMWGRMGEGETKVSVQAVYFSQTARGVEVLEDL